MSSNDSIKNFSDKINDTEKKENIEINILLSNKLCPLSSFLSYYMTSIEKIKNICKEKTHLMFKIKNTYSTSYYHYDDVLNVILDYNKKNNEKNKELLEKEVLNTIISCFKILNHYEVKTNYDQEQIVSNILKSDSIEKMLSTYNTKIPHCFVLVDIINHLFKEKGFKEEFNKQMEFFIKSNYLNITQNIDTIIKNQESTSNKHIYIPGTVGALGIIGLINYIFNPNESNISNSNESNLSNSNEKDIKLENTENKPI